MSRNQHDRAQLITAADARRAWRQVTLVVLLLIAAGCAGLRVEFGPTRECDPSWQGRDAQYIDENFNLHRGRWWNYYRRGQCCLALGLYEKAEDDFSQAIRVRDRDEWDTRTYGMHFTDYFPHRERGIALYYQSEAIVSEDKARERQTLLLRAIDDLKKSHRQQESSRAKFFLNEAQRAFWRGIDLTPPEVSVAPLIYTNQSPVPVSVEAVDRESGVAAIRVAGSNDEPLAAYTFELAEKMKSKDIIVPVDPMKPETVVRVTCIDVLDNESMPRELSIVVDTSPPHVVFTLDARAPDRDGRVSVHVVAKDDRALERIETGEDIHDTYDCGGRQLYADTIRGVPRGDELTVRIVDRAQNMTVSRLLLSKVSVAPPPVQGDWPRAQPALVFTGHMTTELPQRRVSLFPPFDARHDLLHWHAPHLQRDGSDLAGLSLVTRWSVADEAGRVRRYEFDFPPHVCPPQSRVKETSNDVFYIDGRLNGAGDVDRITVDDCEVHSFCKHEEDCMFGHTVRLADLKLNESKKIWVKAFRPKDTWDHPCAEKCLEVKKVDAPDMRLDSVLGIAVQRFAPDDPNMCESSGDDPSIEMACERVIASLGNLRLDPSDPCCAPRFRVYDDSTLGERVPCSTDRNTPGARYYLRGSNEKGMFGGDCVDIVVSGRVWRDCYKGEERFQIKLTAIDTSNEKPLYFPDRKGGRQIPVLAEVYGPSKDFEWYIDKLLAAKVEDRFPRLEARVETQPRSQKVRINRGSRDGLFDGMPVCFYYRGELDRNPAVRFLCGGRVVHRNASSSEVEITHGEGIGLLRKGHVAIPK